MGYNTYLYFLFSLSVFFLCFFLRKGLMQTGLVCLYFPSAGLQLRLPSSLPPRPSVLFFSSFFLSLCFWGAGLRARSCYAQPRSASNFLQFFCFSFLGAESTGKAICLGLGFSPQPGHPGWAWWGALGHSHDCGEERLIRPFKGNKGAHWCWPVVSVDGRFLAHPSLALTVFFASH